MVRTRCVSFFFGWEGWLSGHSWGEGIHIFAGGKGDEERGEETVWGNLFVKFITPLVI